MHQARLCCAGATQSYAAGTEDSIPQTMKSTTSLDLFGAEERSPLRIWITTFSPRVTNLLLP